MQYCGELSRRANYQVLVWITPAPGDVPVLISLRLFLPQCWSVDPEHSDAPGVPEAARAHRPKWQIALDELDRAWAGGVRFDCVTADAEHSKTPGGSVEGCLAGWLSGYGYA